MVPYTEYKTVDLHCMSSNGVGCISANLCNENVEMFSAWSVLQHFRYLKNMGYFAALKYIAVRNLGLSEEYFQRFMDYQIMLDFVITNLDRHMNNISFLRDSNTLEVIGLAPIYDCGNSMFWNFTEIPMGTDILRLKTCTFNDTEVRNLRYVKDRSLLQIDKLPTAEEVDRFYQQDVTMSDDFRKAMVKAYALKVEYLRRFQNGESIWDLSRTKGWYNV